MQIPVTNIGHRRTGIFSLRGARLASALVAVCIALALAPALPISDGGGTAWADSNATIRVRVTDEFGTPIRVMGERVNYGEPGIIPVEVTVYRAVPDSTDGDIQQYTPVTSAFCDADGYATMSVPPGSYHVQAGSVGEFAVDDEGRATGWISVYHGSNTDALRPSTGMGDVYILEAGGSISLSRRLLPANIDYAWLNDGEAWFAQDKDGRWWFEWYFRYLGVPGLKIEAVTDAGDVVSSEVCDEYQSAAPMGGQGASNDGKIYSDKKGNHAVHSLTVTMLANTARNVRILSDKLEIAVDRSKCKDEPTANSDGTFHDKNGNPVAVTLYYEPEKQWTGKQVKPNVAVKADGKTLKKNVDYTVSYGKNVGIGKGTVTVTGEGALSGAKSATFKINPKKMSIKKLAAGKRQVSITWAKAAAAQKVTGYELRCSIKGKGAWTTKTAKAKAASLIVKKLRKGKVYQFQIRAYKKVGGTKYYGEWSAAKTSGKVK